MREKALQFRLFLRTLFGSRVVSQLEDASIREREHYELRLQDKDAIIADLRTELAVTRVKCDRLETVVIPLVSPAADLLHPRQPPSFQLSTEPAPGSWEAIKAEHARQELAESAAEEAAKDGIHGSQQRRQTDSEQISGEQAG